MTIGTSENYPLRIDEVVVPGCGGRIGMTLFPGRSNCDKTLSGIEWHRDLATDLAVIERAQPGLMLTLNETFEFAELGVPDFETAMLASGIPWRHLPIPDAGVPDAAFERAWVDVGAQARAILKSAGLVVIHCRAGLGRTGMIAARLLVELGSSPDDAIEAVRIARPGAIENAAQERYVRAIRATP